MSEKERGDPFLTGPHVAGTSVQAEMEQGGSRGAAAQLDVRKGALKTWQRTQWWVRTWTGLSAKPVLWICS